MYNKKNYPKGKLIEYGMILKFTVSVAAVCIVGYVLFTSPFPGVADQGDFQRVLDVTGLSADENGFHAPNDRFFRFVITDYEMEPVSPLRLLGIIPTTSLIYPVTLSKLACRILGIGFFHTRILAAVYSVLYILGLLFCFSLLGTSKFYMPVLSISLLFVLLDGNYLIWFNSLYGEPLMIIGFLLMVASFLYAIQHIEENGCKPLVFVLSASILFLGSKIQCISALPFILYLFSRILSMQYKKNASQVFPGKNWKNLKIFLPAFLLVLYSVGTYVGLNATCGMDTKYNAVFYGILKNSDNPKKDLKWLGLSEDLAVEAGKHAYLPPEQYAAYVPWSEITQKEFNQKISNFKLIKFYLLHPGRFLDGMQYTASQSFRTGTSLGKYEKNAAGTRDFHRFTLWSDFRSVFFPKRLFFILSFFLTLFLVSLWVYRNGKSVPALRLKIELLWGITAIGLVQFPMPYIGNGEADTAKQLFLFNFIFDIMFIVALVWTFTRIKEWVLSRYRQRSG